MRAPFVFVDAWAWIALTLADDRGHADSLRVAAELRTDRVSLLTTNGVVYEAVNLVRRTAGLAAALALLGQLDLLQRAGELTVVHRTAADDAQARSWLARYADQHFSFTDCTSFAVMAREGIQEAFTADRHFAVAGFTPLV